MEFRCRWTLLKSYLVRFQCVNTRWACRCPTQGRKGCLWENRETKVSPMSYADSFSPSQIFKCAVDLLGAARAAWGKHEVVITGLLMRHWALNSLFVLIKSRSCLYLPSFWAKTIIMLQLVEEWMPQFVPVSSCPDSALRQSSHHIQQWPGFC